VAICLNFSSTTSSPKCHAKDSFQVCEKRDKSTKAALRESKTEMTSLPLKTHTSRLKYDLFGHDHLLQDHGNAKDQPRGCVGDSEREVAVQRSIPRL